MAPEPEEVEDLGNFDDELAALEGDEEQAPKEEEADEAKQSQQSGESSPERSPSPGQVQQSIEQPPEQPSSSPTNKSKNIEITPKSESVGQARKPPKNASPRPSKPSSSSQLPASSPARPQKSSTPNSLGSGAMSESEPESAAAPPSLPAKSHHPFPVDGKFISEKDKAEIMSMPEARREQILFQRMEELAEDKFTQTLRQRHDAQQKEDFASMSNLNKRKREVKDEDDSPRKITTQTAKKKEDLAAYKRSREQRAGQRQRNVERRARNKQSPQPKDGSSGSPDDRDDVQWDERASLTQPRQEQDLTLHELERYRLGRDRFAEVCLTPGFEDATTGLFARVCLGPDNSGNLRYRMCQIKGYGTGSRKYDITLPGNNMIWACDMYVIVKYGKDEAKWPFVQCSNSPITQDEFDRYKRKTTEDNIRIPTRPFLASRVPLINSLLTHKWTDEELNHKQARLGINESRFAPLRRIDLNRMRERAVQDGNEAEIARIDKELAHNATLKLRYANRGGGIGSNGAAQTSKAANTKNDTPSREQPGVSYRKKYEQERALAAALMRQKKASGKTDALARRDTRVKYRYDVDENGNLMLGGDETSGSRAQTPADGDGEKKDVPEWLKKRNQSRAAAKKGNEEDFLASLEMEIDVEIPT